MRNIHNLQRRIIICHPHISAKQTTITPMFPTADAHPRIANMVPYERLTELAPHIRGLEHLDREILIHLPHDLDRVSGREMRVLCSEYISTSFTPCNSPDL